MTNSSRQQYGMHQMSGNGGNPNGSQLNLSVQPSFFNQQNIIGDPVVKPFSISTPNQNQTNINKHFVASASADKNNNLDALSNNGGMGLMHGTASASKQMGAHLV